MRAVDMSHEFLHTCYGGAVSVADVPQATLMHRLSRDTGDLEQWRITVGRHAWVSWTLFVNHSLKQSLSSHILLSPDGCWPQYINSDALRTCAEQSVTLAWFNRLEIAYDPPDGSRQGAFYEQFPTSGSGCLAVWAWGLSVTAGILRSLYPQLKIGVIGHSRGGKAAMLAGAVDAQIDAVISNNSGTGGAASLTVANEGSESLAQLASQFPHWLGASVNQAKVQERLRELDCTALWSRIAPRPLLLLQAQEDHWANPLGTRHVHEGLRSDWAQAQSSLALIEREGGHAMQAADWLAAAQFMRQDHAAWR
jgi:hypothetical protein